MILPDNYIDLASAVRALRRYTVQHPENVCMLMLQPSSQLYKIQDITTETDESVLHPSADNIILLAIVDSMCDAIVNGLIIGNDDEH